MSMPSWQDCTTAAEVVQRGREARARIRAQRAVPIRPAIVVVPPPEPKPVVIERRIVVMAPEDDGPAPPTIKSVIEVVCRHFNMTRTRLLAHRRTIDIVRPRQIAMYLAQSLTGHSLPEIGRRFRGRDHTTVLHAVQKIETLRLADPLLDVTVAALEQQLMTPAPPPPDPNQLTLDLVPEATP